MRELESWPSGRLLCVAARLVEHSFESHLAQHRLTHAGLAALHVLLPGPLSQRELAARCQVEEQTMSRSVEKLVREGYVERRRDPADRRRLLLTATTRGREVHHRAGDLQETDLDVLINSADLPVFRHYLIRIINEVGGRRWKSDPGVHWHPEIPRRG